jgi:hypothetical protein
VRALCRLAGARRTPRAQTLLPPAAGPLAGARPPRNVHARRRRPPPLRAPRLALNRARRQFLAWNDEYGGITRIKFFWTDVLLVTDPLALGTIMGRGEHAIDKAFETYAPINKVGGARGGGGVGRLRLARSCSFGPPTLARWPHPALLLPKNAPPR